MSPLLDKYCRECHHTGGVAPVPTLADYQSVKTYANPIVTTVEARAMPPWGADDSGACGTWEGARWMSNEEISLLAAWKEDGAPEGPPDTITGATPLPMPFFADAFVDIGGVYKPGLGAGGNRCFVSDPHLDRDRLLTAIRVISDDPRAVAQVTLFALDSASAEAEADALDAADPELGYSCFGTTRTSDARLVAGWTWPTPILRLPAGTGVRLGAGRKMVVQVHYNVAYTSASFQSDTRVELELGTPATEARLVAVSADGTLAPGLSSVVVEAHQSADQPMRIVGVVPRMHIRGKSLTLESKGTCLADFPSWDYHDAQLFRAHAPASVDAGGDLHLTCRYNTEGRTEPVVFGEGIDDEECLTWLWVVPR